MPIAKQIPGPIPKPSPSAAGLRWQSRAVLLLVVAPAAIEAVLLSLGQPARSIGTAAALSVGLAAMVLAARAATPAAALLGALLTLCFALTPSWPHSALWVLLATLVLTLGSSRVGRRRKLAMAQGETHGRDAAQVAANLGIAALCGALLNQQGSLLAHTAMAAALAETTADTLASELGQLARAEPRMLLGGRRAPPGTDGAISLPGTLAALGGAAAVIAMAAWAFALPGPAAAAAGLAALAGMFVDSLVGQLLERRGLLNNNAVNFVANVFAAAAAMALLRFV